MKVGKISNTILDRSVVKVISKKQNSNLLNRPAPGADCAAFVSQDCADMAVLAGMGYGSHGVFTAVNNVAVEGGKATAITCSITMPEANREIALKRIMNAINDDARSLGVEIAGGHTEVSPYVQKPVISVNAMGTCRKGERLRAALAKPDQDIVMTKWIGIGGVITIIDEKREELTAHFNERTVDVAYGTRMDMSVVSEVKTVKAEMAKAKTGNAKLTDITVTAMHDVSNGGIYAALWDLAEGAHIGLDVDFRCIPVHQEVIEICEKYDLNPYELDSTGCLLMTTDDGCAIVDILQQNGIEAAVIGRTTAGNDRIIRNQDEVRFLEAPKPDEIHRFMDLIKD